MAAKYVIDKLRFSSICSDFRDDIHLLKISPVVSSAEFNSPEKVEGKPGIWSCDLASSAQICA